MGFQIINAQGEPIILAALDKEAAEFWHKKVDPKDYADPSPQAQFEGLEGHELARAKIRAVFNRGTNWFDSIGHAIDTDRSITYKQDDQHTWNMVRETLLLIQIDIVSDTTERIEAARKYLEPYMALIKHWEDKGYKPRRTK